MTQYLTQGETTCFSVGELFLRAHRSSASRDRRGQPTEDRSGVIGPIGALDPERKLTKVGRSIITIACGARADAQRAARLRVGKQPLNLIPQSHGIACGKGQCIHAVLQIPLQSLDLRGHDRNIKLDRRTQTDLAGTLVILAQADDADCRTRQQAVVLILGKR